MRPYSMDLRVRVLADCDAGLGTRVVATKYSVSESWVRRLKQRRREQGVIAPRRRQASGPCWLPYAEQLRELICVAPDATLEELRQRLGNTMSVPTLSRALRALHLTFKKRYSGLRSKIAPMFASVASNGVNG